MEVHIDRMTVEVTYMLGRLLRLAVKYLKASNQYRSTAAAVTGWATTKMKASTGLLRDSVSDSIFDDLV